MADSSGHTSKHKELKKTATGNSSPRARKRPSTRQIKHHIRNVNHVRLALLVAMLFTLLVATMFRTTPIIFMAALLFTAQFTATLAARFLGRGLVVSRVIPETGYVGDTIQGHVAVKNDARLPAFLVHVQPGDLADETNTKADSSTHSSGAQGVASSVAAPAARLPLTLAGENELLLPILRPGESVEWHPRWKLQRRGVWDVPPAQIGARDPLGLFTSSTLLTEPRTIMVLPRPVPLERVDFRGGESQTHTPQQSSIAADAFDFHGIRAWQAGEAIRRVHWKSTARTGELQIVEWEEDFGSDLCIMLDMRATRKPSRNNVEQPDDTLEVAITLAASVTAHLLNSGHAVRLFCWQEDENSELQFASHEARSGRDLTEALKWLAQLESLTPPRDRKAQESLSSLTTFLADSSNSSSLSHLAQAVVPHLQSTRGQSEAILVLCSAEADFAAATNTFSSISGVETPTVIAIDTASFVSLQHQPTKKQESAKQRNSSTHNSTHKNESKPTSQVRSNTRPEESFAAAGRVRVLRHGQSLAAVLEQ